MRSVIVFALALFLYGCAVNEPRFVEIIHKGGKVITVIEDPNLSGFKQGHKIRGIAQYTLIGKYCTIILLEYPYCLDHEIKHCLHGNWHPPNQANDDLCY